MYLDDKKDGETSVTMEPWRRILLDAADLLERDGWCQGVMVSGGSRCIMGALIDIVNPERIDTKNWAPQLMQEYSEALDHLYAALPSPWETMVHWNDTLGRTKDEVVAHLRKVATQAI